jgi:hypothetical protein
MSIDGAGAEAAAAVGIVPIVGTAACWMLATRHGRRVR